jgi:hypothetical protein
MAALYIFQIVMLSLLSIKRFVFAPLLLPLLLFSVMFHRSTMALFHRPWETLSLRDARDLDSADEEVGMCFGVCVLGGGVELASAWLGLKLPAAHECAARVLPLHQPSPPHHSLTPPQNRN